MSKGDKLCTEGEPADAFFILHRGEFEATHLVDSVPSHVATYAPTAIERYPYIDQLTLLQRKPRLATVTLSSEEGGVWAVTKQVMRFLLKHGAAPPPSQSKIMATLKSVPVLEALSHAQLERFATETVVIGLYFGLR